MEGIVLIHSVYLYFRYAPVTNSGEWRLNFKKLQYIL